MGDLSRSLDIPVCSNIRWAFRKAYEPAPRLLAASCINAAVNIVFPAGIALSVRGLVNSVSTSIDGVPLGSTDAYFWLAFGFAMTLCGSLSNMLNRHLARQLQIRLQYHLNLDILRHHEAMAFAQFEDPSYSDSFTRARRMPEQHVGQTVSASLDLATRSLQAASLLVILIAIEPALFLLLLPVGIPYLIFQWRLSRRHFEELDKRVRKERQADYHASLIGDPSQAGEIRLLGLGPLLLERYRATMSELSSLLLAYDRQQLVGTAIFSTLSVIAVYAALARAVQSIVAGQLTIGDLAVYGSAAVQLRSLVEQCAGIAASLRLRALHVARLRQFLELAPDRQTVGGRSPGRIEGHVEFRNVTFTYPGASVPTLQDLSFSIRAGEMVALVGENGAGKSTVAKLVARLYDPDHGTILFDGRDVRQFDRHELRRQIACTFQDFGRYFATAGENIAFGDWQRLRDDKASVRAVAERTGLDRLIQDMPHGYDTVLGREFGHYSPSGGEWQQIAIARLMARDAAIVILDEPTANLDVAREFQLFKQFHSLARGRTTLLISHRFSTVGIADRILVLHEGRLAEEGSHEELVARGGRYAGLFSMSQHSLTR